MQPVAVDRIRRSPRVHRGEGPLRDVGAKKWRPDVAEALSAAKKSRHELLGRCGRPCAAAACCATTRSRSASEFARRSVTARDVAAARRTRSSARRIFAFAAPRARPRAGGLGSGHTLPAELRAHTNSSARAARPLIRRAHRPHRAHHGRLEARMMRSAPRSGTTRPLGCRCHEHNPSTRRWLIAA